MTHKLPLQPSPEEAAQMRADRLTLPIERDERCVHIINTNRPSFVIPSSGLVLLINERTK